MRDYWFVSSNFYFSLTLWVRFRPQNISFLHGLHYASSVMWRTVNSILKLKCKEDFLGKISLKFGSTRGSPCSLSSETIRNSCFNFVQIRQIINGTLLNSNFNFNFFSFPWAISVDSLKIFLPSGTLTQKISLSYLLYSLFFPWSAQNLKNLKSLHIARIFSLVFPDID